MVPHSRGVASTECIVCDRHYRELEEGANSLRQLYRYDHHPPDREELSYRICVDCVHKHAGKGTPLPGEISTFFCVEDRGEDEVSTRWAWIQLPEDADTVVELANPP